MFVRDFVLISISLIDVYCTIDLMLLKCDGFNRAKCHFVDFSNNDTNVSENDTDVRFL